MINKRLCLLVDILAVAAVAFVIWVAAAAIKVLITPMDIIWSWPWIGHY